MKNTRRLLAAVLALVLAVGLAVPALAQQETYPTQWDLTELYPDVAAWQADFDKVMELIPQHENYRGTLSSAQGLYDYLQFAYMGELTRLQNKLYLYASLGYNLNPSDPVYNRLMAGLSMMGSAEMQHSAFVQPEIYALPLEQREAMLADPLLKPWAYALKAYVDPNEQPLSEETNNVLAILGPSLGRATGVFEMLNSVDVPTPTITMPDGAEAPLTDELYARIVYSSDYDRDFKALANRVILTKPLSYVNTFASLLEATVAQNWAFAQIDKYASSREAAMDTSDVDPAIYDMLIAAARKGAPDYQRYLANLKRGLGLEEMFPFDTADYVSDYEVAEMPYDRAVDTVREALSVLGEDYIAHYDAIVTGGHMDVYPGDTKTPGAFSLSMGEEFMPFQLFNYVGYLTDVSTIAHEMGHAIYSSYAMENQPSLYATPGIFTQEVASTTNELLFYNYLMANAQTDEEKLYYLEDLLGMFSGTFFVQAMYAEFEDAMYQQVEAGGALDAEELSDRWDALYDVYRGDIVKRYPDSRYQWAVIPHFYYNYYVYQYATSVSYAASICQRIMSGEEGAVESYLAFLKQGGSAAPADLLATAGIDPLREDTYQKALDFFSGLVDEYERLVDAVSAQQ